MKHPDPVMHHLIAAMLYAWSLLAVSIAWHSTSLAAWLTATVVCYLAAIAGYQALQASWRAWREHKEVPPSATAPLWPTSAAEEAFEAYDAGRPEQHHAAMAAVAAEPMQQPIRDTAVMPVVLAAPTFGFGPCRVVDAPPVAWMAPAATATPTAAGRHAGTPASSLSEWGAHEYSRGAA
jgi:hypothetical protein